MLRVMAAMLDHPLNDIYIHIDRKVDITPFLDIETKYSTVNFLPERIKVEWGGTSQIDVELLIFEYALNHGNYSYFHMMSGQDLPLHSQDYIHDFIDNKHPGCEFVTVNNEYESDLRDLEYKTRYYHFFVKNLSDSDHSFSHYWHYYLHALAIKVQRLVGVRRHYPFPLKKSLHFVSVTKAFVTYLLSKKDLIKRTFVHTLCADEIFLQSILWNSDFRGKLYSPPSPKCVGSMRKILWVNHKAHIWNIDDYDSLVSSEDLFALKFTSDDKSLLLKLAQHNGSYEAVKAIID